jgi:hypothetical protein
MDATKAKRIVIAAAIGGTVYAVLMSLFYQFYVGEPFNLKKFGVDFLMFAIIMAIVTWWQLRNARKKK